MANKGYCYLCGKYTGLDCHHVFGGSFRNKSTKYKMVVFLCRNCHNEIHFGKNSKELMQQLRSDFQKRFVKLYPNLDFVKIFGRNYLTEPVEEETGLSIKDMDL